ncbi:hypothetical protein AKJ09_00452 [Labilithrix luteola]|uniref:HTH luxR-type domain-containing protein n=1 Tax=Labilithrix luteola TaxID=1391654 RepID=A0A0K1PJS2_9BACT|nr:helix-turn-helix transcriptional regulator [Labilithrix luteola]AKU93788.1 hypothetical protein AKJ09_00452 [Labilithrix luteola]
MKPPGRATALLRTRAPWIALIEAIYAPSVDDKEWAHGIAETVARLFTKATGSGLYAFEHDDERRSISQAWEVLLGTARHTRGANDEDLQSLGVELFDATFYPPTLAITQSETLARHVIARPSYIDEMYDKAGIADGVGLIAHPEPGAIVAVWLAFEHHVTLSPHERRLLSQVTLHVESGSRLRRRPDAVRAVLTTEGRLLHKEDGAPDASVMSERVRRIERARSRKERQSADAVDVWNALVAGEVSIVERYDGGRRQYVVLENAPSRRTHRALSRREIEVLRLAARGVPVKLIGYGLGLSSSVVSTSLANTAAKLSLSNRLDLVRVASLLTDTPAVPVDITSLTSTEHEIFELVQRGLSNEDIARRRARSVHTIANQVANVLKKTRSSTRRALLAAQAKSK